MPIIDNVLSGFSDDELGRARDRGNRLFADTAEANEAMDGKREAGDGDSADIIKARQLPDRTRNMLDVVTDDDREDMIDFDGIRGNRSFFIRWQRSGGSSGRAS